MARIKDVLDDFMTRAGVDVNIIPVVNGDPLTKIDESQLPDTLPILALRNAVLFPGAVFPITIGREKSIKLITEAESKNYYIGAVPQNDFSVEEPTRADMYDYGTVARVLKTFELPDGCLLYTSPSPRDKRQSRMPSSA